MSTSLIKAQEMYDALEEAYLNVIGGKSFTISVGGNSRTYTRQDIKVLREEMQYWSAYIAKLNSGNRGIDVKFGTPYHC